MKAFYKVEKMKVGENLIVLIEMENNVFLRIAIPNAGICRNILDMQNENGSGQISVGLQMGVNFFFDDMESIELTPELEKFLEKFRDDLRPFECS